MAWYRTGTISLTNGSTAVTGSGTAWIANAGIGEAIYGPDGKLYEIAAILSNTSITLASAYLGSTASAQPYVIVPSQSYIRDLANQAAELINSYAETEAGIGQGIFPDGSLSAPALRFGSDLTTGLYRSATNEVTFVSNGVAQFKFNASGATFLTGLILPSATTPAQTAEGSVVWDSDSDLLTVGTGAGRKTMVDTDSTQTLTNKTLTSPSLSNPSISLSSGTANGVAYLNGSKVLTTGSALTFDGTNFATTGTISGTNHIVTGGSASGNSMYLPATNQIGWSVNGVDGLRLTATGLRIGTATPAEKLDVLGNALIGDPANSHSEIRLTNSSQAGTTRIRADAGALAYFLANTEQMRLTSTGLGIGTSSPDYSLCVVKAANDAWIKLQGGGSSQHSWLIGSTNSGLTYYDNTAAAYRMYLDNSGNLGLGVTPSAWSGALKNVQVSNGALSGDTTYVHLSANAYYSAGWKYISNGSATNYYHGDGSHIWRIAPSGTAGNAISFTQAMTLDASGRLGIGTSSPQATLNNTGTTILGTTNWPTTVIGKSAGRALIGNEGISILWNEASPAIGNYSAFFIGSKTGAGATSLGGAIIRGGIENATNYLGYFSVLTSDSLGGQQERMRIDSSGNLLVGKTSTASELTTQGTCIAPYGYLSVVTKGGSVCGVFSNDTDGNILRFYRTSTLVGSIGVTSTNTSYNTSSDYRLKENIQPMQNALATVDKLNPVTYNWKADGSDGQGFIAHELQAVVPDCVTGEKDAVDEEGKPVYQGIDTSFLVATLTKAIQEQQELINQLTARVAQLEGN